MRMNECLYLKLYILLATFIYAVYVVTSKNTSNVSLSFSTTLSSFILLIWLAYLSLPALQ